MGRELGLAAGADSGGSKPEPLWALGPEEALNQVGSVTGAGVALRVWLVHLRDPL